MKVKELIEKLSECDPETEVLEAGSNQSCVSRSLHLVTKVEKLNGYAVIVAGD